MFGWEVSTCCVELGFAVKRTEGRSFPPAAVGCECRGGGGRVGSMRNAIVQLKAEGSALTWSSHFEIGQLRSSDVYLC